MYLKEERWIIKSSQHVSLSKKWWMNTASFSCRLQEAEISVTDEKPLESGVLRMRKINYKNVNSIKSREICHKGKLPELSPLFLWSLLSPQPVLVFILFPPYALAVSWQCLFGMNIVSFLCISQQLCLFLFWRWAAQWYDDILILLPGFSTRRVHIESVKYQHYQGTYDADVWSCSVSVHQQWSNAFHAVSQLW